MPVFFSEQDFQSNAGLWTIDAQQTPYDFYTQRQLFEWDGGASQVPVAAPSLPMPQGIPQVNIELRPACEVIQTVAPYGRRIVQWAAQRQGGAPAVPHPFPNDYNQYLLRAILALDPPPLQEDGQTKLVRAAGTYIYALLRPMWLLDNLNMGATPYDQTPASLNVFQASFFQMGLQNAGGGLG